jgi:hypothetical protein
LLARWVWTKKTWHASSFSNLASLIKLESTKEFVDAFKWRIIIAKRAVMSGRYGRVYTRRRRARDVRRAEECAAHTAGTREEEVTTSG